MFRLEDPQDFTPSFKDFQLKRYKLYEPSFIVRPIQDGILDVDRWTKTGEANNVIKAAVSALRRFTEMMAPIIAYCYGLDFVPDEDFILDLERILDEATLGIEVYMSVVFKISILGLLIHDFYSCH